MNDLDKGSSVVNPVNAREVAVIVRCLVFGAYMYQGRLGIRYGEEGQEVKLEVEWKQK